MLRLVFFSATLAAMVGSLAAQMPDVEHVGLVAPDIIEVRVRAGRVEYGSQVPYEPQPGDRVDRKSHHRWVYRKGKFLGALVGRDEKILYTPDRRVGPKLDTRWADNPDSYRIISGDDPAFADPGLAPRKVWRKSKPSDFARVGPWQMEAPMLHCLYLVLPRPLTQGKTYTVCFRGGYLAGQTLHYDPKALRSEAVHVSQVGFRPDDPAKVAFLSCWMGSGGGVRYREGLRFEVLDQDGKVVWRGKTVLGKRAGEPEDAYKRDYTGTDVYLMDFSGLRRPGTYRICVEGIGCSFPFEISADVWRKAFRVSARGFYHQRSGIALGPPHTTFKRPRCFHPDDGVKVFASTTPLMDSGNGLNRKDNNFGNLVRGKTDQVVPNAWGGYMDAGDWDRRIQHLKVSRLLLELAEMFPGYFSGLSLDIPESGNDLPDIVDEALFNLDCYRRMQTPEGGIRGGIESEEHPRHGEGSWQESLTVMAYAPGMWSSYEYAGVAARAALVLGPLAPDLARTYRASAVKAMEWAEAQRRTTDWEKKYPNELRDSRNLAAAELFRLTGEERWHRVFLETTVFKDPKAELFVWRHHEQRDAPWVYARSDGADAAIKRNCVAAIIREADERVASGQRSAFRWVKYAWRPFGWGVPVTPEAVSVVRAHCLTGEAKYLRCLVLGCQFGVGANPLNLCYTTGLGHRWPRHPLHIDSRITHQPPPPGLTIFGPQDVQRNLDHWGMKLVGRFCWPPVKEWPTVEAYWDVFWYPQVCEFTVQQPMAENAYVWGYLAARPTGAGAKK